MTVITMIQDIGFEMLVDFATVLRDFLALKIAGVGLGYIGLKILSELI